MFELIKQMKYKEKETNLCSEHVNYSGLNQSFDIFPVNSNFLAVELIPQKHLDTKLLNDPFRIIITTQLFICLFIIFNLFKVFFNSIYFRNKHH